MTTKKAIRKIARELKALGVKHVPAFTIAKAIHRGISPIEILEKARDLGLSSSYTGNALTHWRERYERSYDTWDIHCPKGNYTIG